MGRFCCVYGCGKRSERDGLRFFSLPKITTHQGEQTRELSRLRREKWLANIRRDALSHGQVKNAHVCSLHFHQGEPAKLYEQTHPDWAPTVAMGHSSSSVAQASKDTAVKRHHRFLSRSNKKRSCLEDITSKTNCNENIAPNQSQLDSASAQHDESQELSHIFDSSKEVRNKPGSISTEIQTDLTGIDVQILQDKVATKQTPQESLSQDDFKDDEKVRFYTGLPTLSVLMAVLKLISPGLVQRSSLTKFQQLLLTLMRLRLNLPVQDLGYRFNIHSSTVCRTFKSCIEVMYTVMGFLINWPEREELRLTLPVCFRDKFKSCAVIIDCFEVFIERPSDLLARAQTWSSYKHHNTAKFLIGITPQGTVSYISKGWGGRASDKFVTEHCGLLHNLLPGDLVLADRGFDIRDSCGLFCARLAIPSFTRGKPQLAPEEIESTRSIANVRIHVERVIGCVRQKYTILGHGIVPIDYVKSDNGEPCMLDKIALVCCALTNCCKSVIPVD